ncbi:type II toxin-antitoxin system RelE/ParE family toxin [Nostoc sp. TCL26-01]|uniref:type II toxin-antitoxin system RelE/ParE family toxin n=1 Tax=Nostoc sp. TCL26-01 TaxID=2576904 RepID=UPI0015BFE735|nr:type II toxin-antitoxin system RelE/ParE family toxin [Nostoc sp. TCL26-01]QLE56780.1 type II toxin-antitoxin system RelE/ParE family toxin [Nostoc sp. TCL26-01]
MVRINWTNQALTDLAAIGDFIARDAPSFAQVFVNKVFLSVERLENFPSSGRIVPEISQDNIREIIFGSYRIVYLLTDNEVSILTIFHSSRQLNSSDLPGELGD